MRRSAGARGPRLTWLNSALVLIALGAAGCSADGNTSSEHPGRTSPSPETTASASASASASPAKGTPSPSASPTTVAAKPSKTPAPQQTRTASVTSSRTGGADEADGGANDSGSIPQNPNTGPTPPPAPPRPSPTPEWSSAEWSPGDPVETVGAAQSLSAGCPRADRAADKRMRRAPGTAQAVERLRVMNCGACSAGWLSARRVGVGRC